jgi:hypothetical protein
LGALLLLALLIARAALGFAIRVVFRVLFALTGAPEFAESMQPLAGSAEDTEGRVNLFNRAQHEREMEAAAAASAAAADERERRPRTEGRSGSASGDALLAASAQDGAPPASPSSRGIVSPPQIRRRRAMPSPGAA